MVSWVGVMKPRRRAEALQQMLPDWKNVSFEKTLPDLEAATKDIQQRSFTEISSRLEVEAAKIKNESFETFGLKFPVETASRWGIVLILGASCISGFTCTSFRQN